MATLELARKLGCVETIPVQKDASSRWSKQLFRYLFVLDFESTCWDTRDKTTAAPEIIEFSVVLYDVTNANVAAEYQQYVMPMEAPKLIEFCQQFTGISQVQVDRGVPIQTCLMLFNKWVNEQVDKYRLVFPDNTVVSNRNKVAFVTWSDWDLNICLPNECRRKAIRRSNMFKMWIDLRALYKEHYHRRPKGLKGALTEVGLSFIGREHCGLHDARNTAYLVKRMVDDGILLTITKDQN